MGPLRAHRSSKTALNRQKLCTYAYAHPMPALFPYAPMPLCFFSYIFIFYLALYYLSICAFTNVFNPNVHTYWLLLLVGTISSFCSSPGALRYLKLNLTLPTSFASQKTLQAYSLISRCRLCRGSCFFLPFPSPMEVI